MQKPTLFIHIGTHKTGSTTIQTTLSQYNMELRKEGMIYLGEYLTFADTIADSEDKERDKALILETGENIRNRINDAIYNGYTRFILSNEKFSGEKLFGYKNASIIARIMNQMIKPLDISTKIVVYLRRQDKYIESLYSQRVYNGETCTFNEFLNRFDEFSFRWDHLVNSYAEIFGKENICIQRYGKEYLPKKDSLIQSFGQIIGSDKLESFNSSSIQNPGFSRDTLEMTRLMNPYFNKADRKQIKDILKLVSSKQPYEKRSFFSPKERDEFMSRYKKSNATVAEAYLNDSSGSLFPPVDLNADFEPYTGLTPESMSVILSKSIVIVNSRVQKLEENMNKLNNRGSVRVGKKVRKVAGKIISYIPGLKAYLRKVFP